jgi:hypothetical protein
MSKTDQRREDEAFVFQFLRERGKEHGDRITGSKSRKISTNMVRDQLFLDQFQSMASKLLSKGLVQPSGYALRTDKGHKERILNVLLSDLHYGSLLDPLEVPLQYTQVEEARRTAAVGVQVAEYKLQYRKDTTLYVHLLGDIIQGKLHDLQEPSAPMTHQFGAAVYLLSQLIAFWAKSFPNVVVRCTPGNHGRDKRRHHERATSQKWDSFENMIYYAIKMALANHKNVRVEIPYTPYFVADIFGDKMMGTHGDTVLAPGFPSDSILVKNIKNQVNEWNSSEEVEHCRIFAVGHVHTGSITQLANGATFVTNGPLIPADPYALSRGHTSANCGQQVWESVKGHVFGDSRYVQVNKYTDKDRALDKVIKPFKSL